MESFSLDRKGSGADGGATTVARRARAARARRRKQKQRRDAVERYLHAWRVYTRRNRFKKELRHRWDKKVGDLANLENVLRAQGVEFRPPVQVLIALTREFIYYFQEGIDGIKRFPCLAAHWIRSAHCGKKESNIIVFADDNKYRRVLELFIRIALAEVHRSAIATRFLMTLIPPNDSGIKDTDVIVTGMRAKRRENLKYVAILASSRIRKSLLCLLEPSEAMLNREESGRTTSPFATAIQNIEEIVSYLLVDAVRTDEDDISARVLIERSFVADLMTVPGFLPYLSDRFVRKLASSHAWTRLLRNVDELSRASVTLPHLSGSNVFVLPTKDGGSEAYLLGNVLNLWSRASSFARCDEEESWYRYLRAIQNLVDRIPREALCGRSAHILVHLEGGVTRTVAIPTLLRRDLRLINADDHVKAIVRACLSSYETKAHVLIRKDLDAQRQSTMEALQDMGEKEVNKRKSRWAWLTAGSRWAKKLLQSGGAKKRSSTGRDATASSSLQNMSETSRSYAMGELDKGPSLSSVAFSATASSSKTTSTTVVRDKKRQLELVCRMSRLWSQMLRCGSRKTERSDDSMSPGVLLLNKLAFSTNCARLLWIHIEDIDAIGQLRAKNNTSTWSTLFGSDTESEEDDGMVYVVEIFCLCIAQLLLVTDEIEWEEDGFPLPILTCGKVVELLKEVLFLHVAQIDNVSSTGDKTNRAQRIYLSPFLLRASTRLMTQLHSRLASKKRDGVYLLSPKTWLASKERQKKWSPSQLRWILANVPFFVEFDVRAKLFEDKVAKDRARYQPEGSRPTHRFRIRRAAIFEDAYHALGESARPSLRHRMSVTFVASDGRLEAGQDVGGLTKELITELAAIAFDPSYGLMIQTEKNELLYPNPRARLLHGENYLSLFAFIGRMLGKAIYEGIVVEPKFAIFFLRKLLGRANSLNDLATLDTELYKNLIFLKEYEGDVDDLCLDFTVNEDFLGESRIVPLIPGGDRVAVTATNRIRYIHYVSHFFLNVRGAAETRAFEKGFRELIDLEWLAMFNESELQLLISGEDKPLDVNDLRAHTLYKNGYVGLSPTIRRFWRVVRKLDPKLQKRLLRFVTSNERTPRLGFASLHPPFSIARVSDTRRLPTASTCFNTLKLPAYSSESALREKLIQAITNARGFELT